MNRNLVEATDRFFESSSHDPSNRHENEPTNGANVLLLSGRHTNLHILSLSAAKRNNSLAWVQPYLPVARPQHRDIGPSPTISIPAHDLHFAFGFDS